MILLHFFGLPTLFGACVFCCAINAQERVLAGRQRLRSMAEVE